RGVSSGWSVHDAEAPDRLRVAPVVIEQRPEGLIQVLSVAQERPPQDALLHGADFSQRPVAAPVPNGRARFQPMRADDVERKVEHQPAAFDENARSPEIGPDREAPFGRTETGLERADLE